MHPHVIVLTLYGALDRSQSQFDSYRICICLVIVFANKNHILVIQVVPCATICHSSFYLYLYLYYMFVHIVFVFVFVLYVSIHIVFVFAYELYKMVILWMVFPTPPLVNATGSSCRHTHNQGGTNDSICLFCLSVFVSFSNCICTFTRKLLTLYSLDVTIANIPGT